MLVRRALDLEARVLDANAHTVFIRNTHLALVTSEVEAVEAFPREVALHARARRRIQAVAQVRGLRFRASCRITAISSLSLSGSFSS